MNNGLVVKEWIARWNTTHAADRIDQNRPPGCRVMVLGYWLPIWRWHHLEATPTGSIASVRVDSGGPAFAGREGVVVAHQLDREASAALAAAGVAQCHGEGIDEFLQATHGYDVGEFRSTEVPVRDLGSDVSERFTLPILLACGSADGSWRECIRSHFQLRRTLGAKPS